MPRITVTDERSRACRDTNASRTRRRHSGYGSPIVFHGVDTEGTGTGSDHRPVLLSCGTKHLASGSGLKWYDVFDFLYAQFIPGGHAYVGFYLAYDFTKWLESLPESRAVMLLSEYGKAARKGKSKTGQPIYFPVRCADWEFDMLGSKRLKIRPAKCRDMSKCKHPHTARNSGEHRWMYICDVGPFFQTSFLKAIHPDGWPEPIVTQAEYDKIEYGKSRRDIAVLGPEMIEYQKAEIVALEKLMSAQQDGLREMGVYLKPKQWFGPGQIAQELLKRWDMPTIDEIPDFIPDEWQYCAQASYYGGWFEIFAHGLVKKAWSYDINSAYPFIIASLPCLRHGRYSSGRGRVECNPNDLCLVRASVQRRADLTEWDPDNPGDLFIGAMLHRDKNGRIFRPLNTSGYYWLRELQAAERAGCIEHVEYHEWVRYEPCDCPSPLREVAGLYDWRLKIGKNTPLGKALKLAYNSIYGKLAQSVGMPKYANAIYASLITAGCRTMILDAIASHPGGQRAVLMVATDGVYFTSRHPSLPLSKKLGEWEEEEHDNLTLFKPGVYWDDKARAAITAGRAPQFKARGVNAKDFAENLAAIDAQFAAWPHGPKNLCNRPQWKAGGSGWPVVTVHSSFTMTSMVQAIARGKWATAGYVEKSPEIRQSAVHTEKRWGLWYDKEADLFRSMPRWDQGVFGNINSCPESVMYEKRFGREDPWSDEMRESAGITPDGPVSEHLAVVLTLGG